MKQYIAIIGGGNMGQAIANGLLNKKTVDVHQLLTTNSKTKNNKEAAHKAGIIILAIKPQLASLVLEEIKNGIKNQLIISIMAGVSMQTIQNVLGEKTAVVRVMPNLAARVGESMSVWVKNKNVDTDQIEEVKSILQSIGEDLELDSEEKIDKATAISGSGPAYYFYATEQIEHTAKELGFTDEQAKLLVKQTLVGSAELIKQSTLSAEDLRHAVTSKGGTTEAAIKTLKKLGLQNIFEKGIFAAFKRASELAKPHEEKSDKINT